MDHCVETVLVSLQVEFKEIDIERLFAKVYDYYFAPRNVEIRVVAAAEIAKAVLTYKADKQLAPWLMQALACKQRSTLALSDENKQDLSLSIEKVLDNNQSFVAEIVDRSTAWVDGIPYLWTLIFIEVYGEFPKKNLEQLCILLTVLLTTAGKIF